MDTINDIIDTPSTLKPAAARTTRHVTCRDCQHIDTADTIAAGATGVGWCAVQSQYRSMSIERACDSFSDNGGKK